MNRRVLHPLEYELGLCVVGCGGAGAWVIWNQACDLLQSCSYGGLRCEGITSNESDFLGLLGAILYITSFFLDTAHSSNHLVASRDVVNR